VPVNKIPGLTACFEKELYICGYTSLKFLINTVILKVLRMSHYKEYGI
jgi:hypothetical protein